MKLRTLAIDLGASTGRAFFGLYDGEKLELEEIRSFPNQGYSIGSNLYWNTLTLFKEIKCSLGTAAEIAGNSLASAAIDTWGVDYALLGPGDELLTNPRHYRDTRTEGLLEEIFALIPREELYQRTGIQFMVINTLVQLYADKKMRPWLLEQAESLLFMPDLFNFFLTGEKLNEVTIASTSQFFDPEKRSWAKDVLEILGLPVHFLAKLQEPGEIIGQVLPALGRELNLKKSLPIISTASHDTASAVAATPLNSPEESLFISCGTWSLLGAEVGRPYLGEASLAADFTNECGFAGTITLLKNITGLWLLQQCRLEWARDGKHYSYDELAKLAAASNFSGRIDPNHPSFLNPESMCAAIKAYCKEQGEPIPENPAEFTRCIYLSLAQTYQEALAGLESILANKFSSIHIVGGGSQAELLCQFTADITGLPVLAGPVEATVLGNILGQLLALGELKDMAEGRELVKRSFVPREYLPGKN